jgi:hypothetical protein
LLLDGELDLRQQRIFDYHAISINGDDDFYHGEEA